MMSRIRFFLEGAALVALFFSLFAAAEILEALLI